MLIDLQNITILGTKDESKFFDDKELFVLYGLQHAPSYTKGIICGGVIVALYN